MDSRARHLAVIPDGNRRWAEQRGLPAWEGHRRGLHIMGDMVEAAFDANVGTFSFWWGSPANLSKRDGQEVRHIRELLGQWLREQAPALLQRHDAQLRVHGRWLELCPELEEPVATATASGGSSGRTLVVLMAYDGRDEIRAAVSAAAQAGQPEQFERHLWLAGLPPVDLLLRTGAADHISAGFMLWHVAEARMCFPAEMWPDYTPEALRQVLADHARQPRRFGA